MTALLDDADGPVIAVTDFLRAVPDQVSRWVPRRWTSLGTDGFGHSDDRTALRRYFEVDAAAIVATVLAALASDGEIKASTVSDAIASLGIDTEAPPPWHV
ncbi:MAG: hypothetical protein R2698_08165 [Microthrixaceae bacterium]